MKYADLEDTIASVFIKAGDMEELNAFEEFDKHRFLCARGERYNLWNFLRNVMVNVRMHNAEEADVRTPGR